MAIPKTVIGTAYRDIVYANRSGYDYRVIAGDGNDYVVSGDGTDTVLGEGGNDTLIDKGGEDVIHGGVGDDVIYAGAGDDTYYGGDGWDAVSFRYATSGIEANLATGQSGTGFWKWHGMGTDTLVGIEALYGSNYGDRLTGDAGRNNLFGLDGMDTLDGGAGDDWLSGGNGDDVVYAGAGNDTYEGGLGTDMLLAGHVSHGIEIDFAAGTLSSRPGATGADDIGQNRFFGFERVITGEGDDIVDGRDGLAQTVTLNGGDDYVYAGFGDTYSGSFGTDTIDFSGLDGVNVNLANGSAVERNGDGLVRFSGFERIVGSDASDDFFVYGIDHSPLVETGRGYDRVWVSDADATVDLGTSDDFLSATNATVTVAGGSGNDTIRLRDGASGAVSGDDGSDIISVERLASGRSATLDGGSGFDRLTIASSQGDGLTVDMNAGSAAWRGGNYGTVQFAGFEQLRTGDGDDLVQGDGAANSILSYDGDDTLSGNGGDDMLSGGAGDDILSGGDGDDILSGGDGADLLSGGAGQDTFLFTEQSGSDRITDFDAAGLAGGGDLLELYDKFLIDGTAVRQASDMDTNRDGRIGVGDTGIARDGDALVLNFADGILRLDGVEALYYDSFMF